MTPKMKRLLWPLELDRYVAEASLKAAKHRLTKAERKGIDKALDGFLAAELDAIKRFARRAGRAAPGLREGHALAAVYKGRDEADQAQELGKELARDAKFKRELAAERAFQKLMRKAGDNPAAQTQAMATVAKTYQGTYYGQLAADGGVAPHPLRRFVDKPLKLLPEAEQKEFVARQQASSAELLKKLPGTRPCTPTRASGSLSSATFPIASSATRSSPNWSECTTSFASCTGSIRPSASGTERPSSTPSRRKRILRSLRRCSPSKNES